jgi:hypothetical protein
MMKCTKLQIEVTIFAGGINNLRSLRKVKLDSRVNLRGRDAQSLAHPNKLVIELILGSWKNMIHHPFMGEEKKS